MTTSLAAMDEVAVLAKLKGISERILQLAARNGASQAEVGVSKDLGLSVQVREGDVETVEFNHDNSFGISVYFGQKKGMATTTDTSDDAVAAAVEAACNIARFTAEDEFAGLADPALMAKDVIELDLDHPSDLSVEDVIEQLKTGEAAALSFDPRVKQCDGISLSSHRYARVYANSHGFFGESLSTRFGLSSSVITEDSQGKQRDHWYSTGRKLTQLEPATAVAEKAAERAVAHLSSRSIKTCKVPILFAPEISRGVFGHGLAAIRGGSLYRKSSFLLDSLGQQIFPEFVSIEELPHLVGGLASGYFDNEGVATHSRHIVSGGVLEGYILGSYSARKLGMATTGNAGGLHNVVIKDTGQSFQDLLATLGTGFLVTEVMGQGVNMVTGDYSRGASGFWVENGEVQFPVHEVTIAGNLREMFLGIQAIGTDVDLRSSINCGSILINEMTVAGS